MAYIGRGTESISNVEVLDNLTFNGSASYTLQKSSVNFVPSSANNLLISISGVVQQGNFSVSGSTITFDTTVSGSDTCDYTNVSHSEPAIGKDAIQSATYDLLEMLDLDSDGKLDIKFTEQDLEISSSEIAGIPYDYSMEVHVRKWR